MEPKLSVFSSEPSEAGQISKPSFYFPGPDADWKPRQSLERLIDDAYIQWPHIYMAPNVVPSQVGYHHLRVPGDVSMLLNVDAVHRLGVTGSGIRVAMIDSGFDFSHPYSVSRGYNLSSVLAPGANQVGTDGNGHGTGEAANVLAVAPDVTFIGIKLDHESNPGLSASVLEGFQEALTGCSIDQANAAHDGTTAGDGWGVFSGTSAAAPQLAGVCALLLDADSSLTPADIKAILSRTTRDVTRGQSNAASNEGIALSATAGRDSATGTGLVDAFAAVMQV